MGGRLLDFCFELDEVNVNIVKVGKKMINQ
jgi:hypothetical protein